MPTHDEDPIRLDTTSEKHNTEGNHRQPWPLFGYGLGLLVALILCWLPNIDLAAENYLAGLMSDNLLVYGTARIINALISVIQSVEISLSLGAGIAVNLGEALDPLNDLIERFSGFVLYGLAALGIQQIALTASTSLVTKLAASLVFVSGFLLWFKNGTIANWLKRLIVIFILARFAFVVEVGLGWSLDKLYFNDQQQIAVTTLNSTEQQLQEIRDRYVNAADDNSIFTNVWESARGIIGADDQQGIADVAAGAIVQLIVILFLRSILLPLGFFWLLLHLLRKL